MFALGGFLFRRFTKSLRGVMPVLPTAGRATVGRNLGQDLTNRETVARITGAR